MSEHVWIELIAAGVLVAAQIIAFLKSVSDRREDRADREQARTDRAQLAIKVEDSRAHMSNQIETIGRDVNGKVQQLIESREAVGEARGMAAGLNEGRRIEKERVGDVSIVMDQFSEMWIYLHNRAIAEMVSKGLVAMPSMAPVAKVFKWYEPLMDQLKPWYENHQQLDELQLFFSCHKEFGGVLLEKICKPYGVFNGACIQLAIEVVRKPKPETKTEA